MIEESTNKSRIERPEADDLNSMPTDYLIKHLPLPLINSEIVPPPPNPGIYTVDWMPEFVGYAWIAYGASSCLVISQFPSPVSHCQTELGPIFRQAFELCSAVVAVAWSPVMSSLSVLAAASGDRVCLFENDSGSSHGSFSWRQIKELIHSCEVESVMWTGSGDGIISGGKEVVVWKSSGGSFEVAFKFEPEKSHTLVSTSWSLGRPFATAPLFCNLKVQESFCVETDAENTVTVHCKSVNSDFVKSELRHPQPISFIQWRPFPRGQPKRAAKKISRDILLTCCLDGAVRLWCEIDDGKIHKKSKDITEKEAASYSFFIVAIVETRQVLNGILGTDLFIVWATDTKCSTDISIGDPSSHGCTIENPGECEWLIGFGPGTLLTFWVIHCVDDIFPLRFPRVTLWKQQELKHHSMISHETCSPPHMKHYLLNKVVICRARSSGPPNICSLIQLFTSGVVEWSLLHIETPIDKNCLTLYKSTTDELSCYSGEILRVNGHFGHICCIKTCTHSIDTEVAASLDSNGIVLIWTFSTDLYHNMGPATLSPAFKMFRQLVSDDINCRFTSLSWLQVMIGEEMVLLLGHANGIHFFLVKICDGIMFHHLGNLRFPDNMLTKDGPCDIHSNSLFSPSNNCLSFLLLGVWTQDFHALSWEITFHHCDLLENCTCCTVDTPDDLQCGRQGFKSNFSGKGYSITWDLYSCNFPDPHGAKCVVTYALVQFLSFGGHACNDNLAYHVATGCASGSLKLWRSGIGKSSLSLCWQLVGTLSVKEPIIAISLSSSGQKVAAACSSKIGCTIYIWEILAVPGLDNFLPEGSISLDENVVTLNWLTLGNGRLLLGVGLRNEVQIYAYKRADVESLNCFDKSSELGRHFWICLAVARFAIPLQNFIWCPNMMLITAHKNYFSLTYPWLLLVEDKKLIECHGEFFKADCHICQSQSHAVTKGSPSENAGDESLSRFSDGGVQSGLEENALQEYDSATKLHLWSMLEVEDKLCGPLPVYHPKALLINIYSGDLKRARVAMNHLVTEQISSNNFREINSNSVSGDVPSSLLSEYFEGFSSMNFEGRLPHNVHTSVSFSPIQQDMLISEPNSRPDDVGHVLNSYMKSDANDILLHLEQLHESAAIANKEMMQLLAIADFLGELCSHDSLSNYISLDEPGRRFWVSIRLQQLLFCRRFGRSASIGDIVVGSELIAWAVQSNCQDVLSALVFSEESSWQEMRNFGVGFWLSNPGLLQRRMEKLARNKYWSRKDPKDCALLYVALNRIQVLAGLFRKDEKDKPLVGFLSRNFQEEKNRAAAVKNAYVLMSKHQLELAITFFLLGGDTISAITVCAKNLGDEQLALVICRLVGGEDRELIGYLVSKFLLPTANEKRDNWLVSILQWIVGNPMMSYRSVLAWHSGSPVQKAATLSRHDAFLDTSVGEYCLVVASTSSMRNAIGEKAAFGLVKLAHWMIALSLRQSGLAVHALECISSFPSILQRTDHGNVSLSTGDIETVLEVVQPLLGVSSNWVAEDMSFGLEYHIKLDLAMQFWSQLLRKHAARTCSHITAYCGKQPFSLVHEFFEDPLSFIRKIYTRIDYFEQKFSLVPGHVINLLTHSFLHYGVLLSGFNVNACTDQSKYERITASDALLQPNKPVTKFVKEFCLLLSRFILICNLRCSLPKLNSLQSDSSCKMRTYTLEVLYMQGITLALQRFRSNLVVVCGSCAGHLMIVPLAVFSLFEYFAYFSFALLHKKLETLVEMVQPFFMSSTADNLFEGFDITSLGKVQNEIAVLMSKISFTDVLNEVELGKSQGDNVDDRESFYIEDHQWMIVGICLWKQFSGLARRLCTLIIDELEESHFCYGGQENKQIAVLLAEQLSMILTNISSHWVRQFAMSFSNKMEAGANLSELDRLEWSTKSEHGLFRDTIQGCGSSCSNAENPNLYAFEKLWTTCVDLKVISDAFAEENIDWMQFVKHRCSEGWGNLYVNMQKQDGKEIYGQENKLAGIDVSPVTGLFRNGITFFSSEPTNSSTRKNMSFQPSKKVCRVSGELVQALCINSLDHGRGALACSQKGIVFFSWEDTIPDKDFSGYPWSDVDWPYNEWPRAEETPMATHVGFESRKDGYPEFKNSSIKALSSHPCKPFFLAGSRNSHIFLREFGKAKAISTYSVPATADVSALASVTSLQFDCFGHRFSSSASDGTVCTWQLESGRMNHNHPIGSFQFFDEHALDIAYVSYGGSVIGAAGYNSDGTNVVIWDTLAPQATSIASVVCHKGGARSLDVFDEAFGSGSLSPLLVTGGRGGDVAIHDFRFIVTGRTEWSSSIASSGGTGSHGFLWFIPKAHLGSVTRITTIASTSLFLTGGKDGDIKLWDAKRMELVYDWPKLHERRTFLQPSSHGHGGVIQAAVTDIQVIPRGFISCGGDGSVKLVQVGNASDADVS